MFRMHGDSSDVTLIPFHADIASGFTADAAKAIGDALLQNSKSRLHALVMDGLSSSLFYHSVALTGTDFFV